MIQISGMPFTPDGSLKLESAENSIVKQMHQAPSLYSYPSTRELLFELKARKNIIDSAEAMSSGKMKFTIFEYARCNPNYWHLSPAGGFLLKYGVSPSEAISDIYKNSSLYATECATACVIIFYHAVLKSISPLVFDSLFQNLYLYSWHSDRDLGLRSFYAGHFLPGDVVYFNNPEFSSKTPWFRGENAVALGSSRFFGHGFGIRSDKEMIEILNNYRKPGSSQSAFLTNQVTSISFSHLAAFALSQREVFSFKSNPICVHHNKSSISFLHYLFYLRTAAQQSPPQA